MPRAPHTGDSPRRPSTQKPRADYKPRPTVDPTTTKAPPVQLRNYPGVVNIVLRPGTATPVLAGHPWIFSGAIQHVALQPGQVIVPGQACAVFDLHGRFLAHGCYNPNSQIAIRVVTPGQDGLEPDRIESAAELVVSRLNRAVELRAALGLPSAQTTAYRLVNSEGDGLPGLVVDRFGDGAVVVTSSASAALWLPHVIAWLNKEAKCSWVVTRVPQDIHPSEGLIAGNSTTHGNAPDRCEVAVNGLKLWVEPSGGQKSGMYCDQRENHLRVAEFAKDRFVLDAYSNTGGFGLHAARAGARKVRSVDASQRAIDLLTEHATQNHLSIQAEAADAIHVLQHFADAAESDKPDLVIVDPPKFATKAGVLDQAIKKYTHLNTTAMRAVQAGGILVSCSCSGLVDRQSFLRVLGQSAHNAGKTVQLLEFRGAAADHPVAPAHMEGQYLKVAICRITAR